MRILLAENHLNHKMLQDALAGRGHEVIVALDSAEAWRNLQDRIPELVILDLEMPGLDGIEFCRRARRIQSLTPSYIILLTNRGATAEVVAGLAAGANDFLAKPFNQDELLVRVQVGQTVIQLQSDLAARVRELDAALAQVKRLQKLLPICCHCKKIQADDHYWQDVETYFSENSGMRFTHGICPACWREKIEPELRSLGMGTRV